MKWLFFDITASAHGRATMVSVIERAADEVSCTDRRGDYVRSRHV